jgi:hypothetical protein
VFMIALQLVLGLVLASAIFHRRPRSTGSRDDVTGPKREVPA